MSTLPDSPATPRFMRSDLFEYTPATPEHNVLTPVRFVFPPLTPTDMEMNPAEIIAEGTKTPSSGSSKKRFFSQESPNHVDECVQQMGFLAPSPNKKQMTADKPFSVRNSNPTTVRFPTPEFEEAGLCLVAPDEEAFQVPTYNKAKSEKRAPPPTPIHSNNPKGSRRPLTEDALHNQYLLNQGKKIWGKFPLYYQELGKTAAGNRQGNFHQVWLLLPTKVRPEHERYLLTSVEGTKKPTILKTPNANEIKKSERIGDSLPLCLQRVVNANANYDALCRDLESGKFPQGLSLAETRFYCDEGVITQERWDEEFDPEVDMLDLHVVEIVKEMLRKIANKEVSRADFKADNLGWVKVGEINLADGDGIISEILQRRFDPAKDLQNRKVMAKVKNALQKSLKGQQMIKPGWKILDIKLENGEMKIVLGELKLFDFLEETDNESEYTMEQFVGTFALDFAMHNYLHPFRSTDMKEQ